MKECNRCHLGPDTRKKGLTSCVMGVGDPDLGIMMIGEAPGQEEARRGLPFIGGAGILLDECIGKTGHSRDDIVITNLVKCQPPANRDPSIEEMEACEIFLEKELSAYEPKVVLTLGAFSTRHFLGDVKISEVRGYVFEKENYRVVPTFHPAAVLRRPELVSLLQADINKVFTLDSGTKRSHNPDYRYFEDFDEVISALSRCDEFAFDLETDGLDPFVDPILCCAFTFKEGSSICVPFSKEHFEIIFGLPPKKITQGDFDVKFLRLRHGIEVKNWHFNTMTAHHLLDENTPHGLKTLASIYTDVPYYNLPSKEKLSLVEPAKVHKYNCYDADVTYRLYKLFDEKLKDERLNDLYYDRVMPLNRVLLDVESDGVAIDTNKLRDLSVDMSIKMHTLDGDLRSSLTKDIQKSTPILVRELWKIPDHIPNGQLGKFVESMYVSKINWNSPKQVAKVLFDYLGLPCKTMTPKGKASVKDYVLDQLKDKHEIPRMLREYRGIKKGLSTYLDGGPKIPKTPEHIPPEQRVRFALESLDKIKKCPSIYMASSEKGVHQHIAPDGRVHGDYLLHGTSTGRLSSARPNLQNVPREGGYRNIYVADDGFLFVGYDYKQIELRAAAHKAGDEELLQILNRPDSKIVLTELVTSRDFTEGEWVQTKAAVYGVLYGRGKNSLAEDLKIGIGDAELLIDGFFQSFPKVRALIKEAKRQVKENGYLINDVGRKRRFPYLGYSTFRGGDSRGFFAESQRQSINFWIQSLASDILSEKTVVVHEYLKDKLSYIVLTLHDALYLQVSKKEEEIIDKVKDLLEKDTIIGDVLVECKVGTNWGEC